MNGTVKDKLFKIKSNLTSLDSQPLSRALLIIILFLDIFILTSIFDGLDKHTRQLSSPDKIFETVYDIIPKKLLKELIDLLESLKIVAIWHYLVIAIAVAAALFLIYVFQKKLFSRDKLMERRIAKGLCQQCGKHLSPGSPACPFCGFAQFKACVNCNQPTMVYGKYCRTCGKEQ